LKIGQSFVRGYAYLGSGQLVANIANLAMQIVIARFLGPAEFGLYALCFAIDQVINIVGAFSLSFALIQTEDEPEQRDYDTAFILCAIQGLAGLVIALAIAPILGSERSAQAAWILIALALARILRLLAQSPQAQLERSLRYARVTAIHTFVAVVPNGLAVLMASQGFGAWSLALRDVLVAALLFGLVMRFSDYRFKREWSRESSAKLMAFGRKMFASRGIETLMERLDSIAVGLLFGNQSAGLYHTARFLSEAGFIATRPVERISLNLYARVQNDPARLARAWDLTNYFLLRVMLAGASALLVFPEPIVEALYGDEWAGLSPLLRWLAVYAGLFPIFHNVKNLLYGLGDVTTMVRVRLIQLCVFIVSIGIAAWLEDVTAMAAGLAGTTVVALALAWHEGSKRVQNPPWKRLAGPPVLVAATALLLTQLFEAGWLDAFPPLSLPFLPPIVFLIGIFLTEGSAPLRELRYLRDQARD
jgi:O-antigen/teichoic acid export membrane protein